MSPLAAFELIKKRSHNLVGTWIAESHQISEKKRQMTKGITAHKKELVIMEVIHSV